MTNGLSNWHRMYVRTRKRKRKKSEKHYGGCPRISILLLSRVLLSSRQYFSLLLFFLFLLSITYWTWKPWHYSKRYREQISSSDRTKQRSREKEREREKYTRRLRLHCSCTWKGWRWQISNRFFLIDLKEFVLSSLVLFEYERTSFGTDPTEYT